MTILIHGFQYIINFFLKELIIFFYIDLFLNNKCLSILCFILIHFYVIKSIFNKIEGIIINFNLIKTKKVLLHFYFIV